MVFEPEECWTTILELKLLSELIRPGSAVFGFLVPCFPSANSRLFFEHDLLGLEFNSFSSCEFQLFYNVYPSSPNINFLIVYKELEASRRVLVFSLLNVGFKLCTFFSNRLMSLIFLIIYFGQLVHLPFCETVVTIDFVVPGWEFSKHSVDWSFILLILCICFYIFESFGLQRLFKNIFDAQKKSFLLFHSVSPTPENVSLFARILPINSPAFNYWHNVNVMFFKDISRLKRSLCDRSGILVLFCGLFLFKLDFGLYLIRFYNNLFHFVGFLFHTVTIIKPFENVSTLFELAFAPMCYSS